MYENLYEMLEKFDPCPGYISQSIHWSVIIHPYTDKTHIEGVQVCLLGQIDDELSNLQNFVNS